MEKPLWRVRIQAPGGPAVLLSRTEPVVHTDTRGQIVNVDMDPVQGTPHSDTIGYIDWSAVHTVVWRILDHTDMRKITKYEELLKVDEVLS